MDTEKRFPRFPLVAVPVRLPTYEERYIRFALTEAEVDEGDKVVTVSFATFSAGLDVRLSGGDGNDISEADRRYVLLWQDVIDAVLQIDRKRRGLPEVA